MYREPSKEAMPSVPMATQAPMATNYASFLNRMGEETSAINKAKKAFESKLVELGLEPAPKVVVETKEDVVEDTSVILSNEETAKIKEILQREAHDHEDDEGWYAHHEIHGSKGVSKEDWKKGWRLNSKGERVQSKKVEKK